MPSSPSSTPPGLGAKPVLVTIDAQRGFDDPQWGPRNNPALEANLQRLHGAWRRRGLPLWHVRHASTNPSSTLAPGQPGHDFKPEAVPHGDEPVFTKTVHSSFIGTDLESRLRWTQATDLVLAGIQTNYCVATTARMAGNLGFRTLVVADACATFGQKGLDGTAYSAHLLHDVALAELQGEFAEVLGTAPLLERLETLGNPMAARPPSLYQTSAHADLSPSLR